jgi:carbonic anhydrase
MPQPGESGRRALERLREGNRRFVWGLPSHDGLTSPLRRSELVSGQKPFAVVLGCSDSRVPVELVFDQGLGDLFVIRVAGNIVAPSLIGSVEFAVEQFGTSLVVVLGHTRCGAIEATLEELARPSAARSPNLQAVVDRIRPAVEPLLASDRGRDPASLAAAGVRANVRASVDQLRHGSEALERRIREGELLVVGAEYALETGAVEFFHGVPAASGTTVP